MPGLVVDAFGEIFAAHEDEDGQKRGVAFSEDDGALADDC